MRIEPDGLVAAGYQPGLGPGVGAGEQHDVMPEIDQGVGKVGNDPLGAAVEAGWHRFRGATCAILIDRRSYHRERAPSPSSRRWRTELPPMMIASMIAAAAR